MTSLATSLLEVIKQEGRPTNWQGSAKRDVTRPTATASIILAIGCSENFNA